MLTISEKSMNILSLLSAILWIYLIVALWTTNETLIFISFIACTIIAVILFIQGNVINNTIGIKAPLLYPIFISLILWIIPFVISYSTKGKTEPFILGMHPAQFWIILLFWIGSFIVISLSYYQYFDKYILTDESWNSFLEEVEKSKEQ